VARLRALLLPMESIAGRIFLEGKALVFNDLEKILPTSGELIKQQILKQKI